MKAIEEEIMKQILFIGDVDKTELLFPLAKLLSIDKKVVIIEVSQKERYRHAFPKIDMKNRIHQYDGFDVWENVFGFDPVKSFLHQYDYEIALIDIDDAHSLKQWENADHYYLSTSYDNPTLIRNKVLVEALFEDKPHKNILPITKIIYDVGVSQDESYLNQTLDHLPIIWNESITFYPDEKDMVTKINNQISNTVRTKSLSKPFKKMILQIGQQILEEPVTKIKTQWKWTERSK